MAEGRSPSARGGGAGAHAGLHLRLPLRPDDREHQQLAGDQPGAGRGQRGLRLSVHGEVAAGWGQVGG